MHLCAELTAAFWTLEPFGEIGANFSLQLSSRTRFDKINKKKVIAENQCEKHKKSSLVVIDFIAWRYFIPQKRRHMIKFVLTLNSLL